MDIIDARIEWNIVNDPPTPIAPGVAAPRAFTAHLTLDNDSVIGMEVEIVDRVPRCVELVVRRDDIASRDLRLPVQRWLDEVVGSVAWTTEKNTHGATVMRPPATDDDLQRVTAAARTATRRRSTITDDDLRRASDAYRKGGIVSVQATMHVSEATAYRYIRKAREASILEPRQDG